MRSGKAFGAGVGVTPRLGVDDGAGAARPADRRVGRGGHAADSGSGSSRVSANPLVYLSIAKLRFLS